MNKMKFNISSLCLAATLALAFSACDDDKGNYTYSEINKITGNFPESVVAMQGIDNIEITPTIESSIDGPISANDPNYEFGCQIDVFQYTNEEETDGVRWTDINPNHDINVNWPATFDVGTYMYWYTVTDKRTGVVSSFTGEIRVLSTTTEGWMVVSNNGADKKVRLDMIFKDSKGDTRIRYDVFDDKCPPVYDGISLKIMGCDANPGDHIALMTNTESYELENETLQYDDGYNMNNYNFIVAQTGMHVVDWTGIYGTLSYAPETYCCVTDNGNAYGIVNSATYGSGFEFPLNTDLPGNAPTFKVAPKIGTGQSRPNIDGTKVALFYDVTNKRFMRYDNSLDSPNNALLLPLVTPSNTYFSFEPGMNFVDMISTRFNAATVYTILQDAQGKRHIYGIRVDGQGQNAFGQTGAYEISDPNFHVAEHYAFHSQFPILFYSIGNTVYVRNYITDQEMGRVEVPADEKITVLKFNLFQSRSLSDLIDHSDEFLAQQYDLIVASGTGAPDSANVRFYHIASNGQATMFKEYGGLGEEIFDVTYRERRE